MDLDLLGRGVVLALGGIVVTGMVWLFRRGFISAVSDQLRPLHKRIDQAFTRTEEVHELLRAHLKQETNDVAEIRKDIEVMRAVLNERREQKWYRN